MRVCPAGGWHRRGVDPRLYLTQLMELPRAELLDVQHVLVRERVRDLLRGGARVYQDVTHASQVSAWCCPEVFRAPAEAGWRGAA